MVQVSPSPPLDVTPPSVHSDESEDKQEDLVMTKVGSPCGINDLEVNTTYHDYENYIEDGLICLKHKVRNLEKKKVGSGRQAASCCIPLLENYLIGFFVPQLKLEDYKKRLTRGAVLNKDQMARSESCIHK